MNSWGICWRLQGFWGCQIFCRRGQTSGDGLSHLSLVQFGLVGDRNEGWERLKQFDEPLSSRV